jgi:endoglucanase
MDMYKILKEYTELPGPSGYESRIQRRFMKDLAPYAEEVKLTNVGNVLAHIPGEGRRVVIFGHADEISYFVLSITDDGFLHISGRRSNYVYYPYNLVGQKALVIGDKEDVRGVFVSASGHLLSQKEREKPLDLWNVYVDIGAESREEVLDRGVHVGSPVIWNPTTERIGEKVFGKAMDDRFTYPVMLGLAENLKGEELSCDLYLASTVQEEMGLKGASSLSRLGFDVSLALDIGIAGDYPSVEEGRMPVKLGKGPVITYKDASIVYNIEVINELRSTAERNDIPYQNAIFENYGSDSSAMISGGSRPNLVCTPARYSHTSFEMVHVGDMANLVTLLTKYVTEVKV